MPLPSPPTRPALRARYETRRSELVAAAAELFAERGYDGTSMSELTAATGLAAGGLYHYIEGKDDLLIAICDELLEPLLAEAEALLAKEAPAVEQLRELVRAWVGHVVEHRHHMLVFTQERHAIEKGSQWRKVREDRKRFERLVEGLLERICAEGRAVAIEPRLLVAALLGMVNHTAQWYRPRGRLTPVQIADGYLALILGGPKAA